MTLSNKAYEKIKNDIIACLLRPGDQVNQSQLAKKYRTGMMPIREALQRLALEGYLQVIPRFGYIVKPISLSEVRDIYEVRSIVEPEAARLAAIRAPIEQLDQISAAANFPHFDKDRNGILAYFAHHNNFHRMIAAASGNQRLLDIVSKLIDERMRFFHLGLDLVRYGGQGPQSAHIELAQALRDRDSARAAQVAKSHVSVSQDAVLRVLLEQTGNEIRSSDLRVQITAQKDSAVPHI